MINLVIGEENTAERNWGDEESRCMKAWVGLELHFGLLPTFWDLFLRTVWRHAITILICHLGDQ